MGLLINIVNVSNHTKSVLLSNQKCVIQSTPINLDPNEYNQEFCYHLFLVKLDRRVGSFNTQGFKPKRFQHDYSNQWIENHSIFQANVNVNLMEQNVIQINGGIIINVNVSVKLFMHVKKIMFGILVHVIVKIENI